VARLARRVTAGAAKWQQSPAWLAVVMGLILAGCNDVFGIGGLTYEANGGDPNRGLATGHGGSGAGGGGSGIRGGTGDRGSRISGRETGGGGSGAGGSGTGGIGTGGIGTGGSGAGGIGAGGIGTGGGTAAVKRVFMTSQMWNGDLGGLSGADMKCQEAADAEMLGGDWIAWLSDETNEAGLRVQDVGPWYLVDETVLVAIDIQAIVTSGPLVAIDVHENQQSSAGEHFVWTGTDAAGAASPYYCDNWNDAAPNQAEAVVGESSEWAANRANGEWTYVTVKGCNEANHLYCFEQ